MPQCTRFLRNNTRITLIGSGLAAFFLAQTPLSGAIPFSVDGDLRLPDRTPARFAAVWLEGDTHAKPLSNAFIDQREKTFIPHVLVVTRGTRVAFPNNDTVFHNVFAFFEAKKFDIGMYPRGESGYVTFEKPGIVSILCNIHPKMSAFVVIVDTPYYTVASKNGHFHLANVPAGKYILKAWHESGVLYESPLNVADTVLSLSLTLERR